MRLLCLVLLTSCCLHHPYFEMPPLFEEEAGVPEHARGAVDLSQWWEQFEDPILSQLIERAIRCNLDLQIAREKICQARAVYGMEFSYLLPWVDQVDIFDRIRNSQTVPGSPFLGGTFTSLFQVGFDSVWELDLFGKIIDRARAAGMDYIGEAERVRQIHVSITAEVAALYFHILEVQQQLLVTQDHIQFETQLVTFLSDRFAAGIDPALDLYTAKSVLNARQTELPQLEMERKQTIFSLAVLVDLPPEELLPYFTNWSPLPIGIGKIPHTLPCDLLCRRGDVRGAEYDLAASGARVLAARKELFPTLSLSSLFGFASGFATQLFQRESRQWIVEPSLLQPLFHGGHIRSFIRSETAKQHEAALQYEQIVLKALQEMESGLVGYSQMSLAVQTSKEETENYLASRELAEILYIGGVEDFLFFIEIERNLFTAQLNYLSIQYELLHQLISVYKALGGGWEC